MYSMKRVRKIIEIDDAKCNGCGLCIASCHENALAIVDGKAKLIRDSYCDGLGNCLGECPRGAITIIEREAEPFAAPVAAPVSSGGGCPGMAARTLEPAAPVSAEDGAVAPELRQWPVQLHLVPVHAPYWENADLLIAADCTAVAYGDFQRKLLRGRRVVIACPKLDDGDGYAEKLAAILRENAIRCVTVAIMEVPCCNGLLMLARRAVEESGRTLEIKVVKIGLDGRLL